MLVSCEVRVAAVLGEWLLLSLTGWPPGGPALTLPIPPANGSVAPRRTVSSGESGASDALREDVGCVRQEVSASELSAVPEEH